MFENPYENSNLNQDNTEPPENIQNNSGFHPSEAEFKEAKAQSQQSAYEWPKSSAAEQEENVQNAASSGYSGGFPQEPDGSYHLKGDQIPSANSETAYQNTYAQMPYGSNAYGQAPYVQPAAEEPNAKKKKKKEKAKKEKKPITRGAVACIMICSIAVSGALGIGGGFLAAKTYGGGMVVNQSAGSDSSASAVKTSSGETTTAQIVEKTANSVVEITTETVTTGNFFQQYVSQGAGSGVIISEDGYILTNEHVIEGASTVTVRTKDGTSYTATVIGEDAKLDIALIKIDASDLAAATFGDSSQIQVGDYAVAIGNPLGKLGGTVTDGIISALDRDVTIDGETRSLLQTNAAINPGNSGGGLFNSSGELIGVVCAKASSSSSEVEGLGFAIPINDVLDILNDLKQYGYVQGRIDLGMTLTDVASGSGYQAGCYVQSVDSGSSAQTAGFKSGDLITKVNGKEVASSSEVMDIIEQLNVGDTVTFTVTRGTRTGELSLTLQEYNPKSDFLNSDNQQSADNGGSIWDYFS